MQRLIHHATRRDVGFACLCAAAVLYGAYGYPTPDRMGVVEWLVAGLLCAALACAGPASIFDVRRMDAGRFFLFFGLSVPLMTGVALGNVLTLMFRDVIPFLFMMMPVLYAGLLRARGVKFLAGVVSCTGVLLAVRSLVPGGGILGSSDSLDYLANMPSVLMAAILFAGLAITRFCERFTVRACFESAALFVFSAVCVWPLAESLQRASIAMYGAALLGIFIFCLMMAPKRAVVFAVLGMLVCIPFYADILEIFEALAHKNILVGSNMRLAELSAVWDHISGNAVGVVFGQGWGASYASPAVAGITVNYTHSLLSALLLKTGIAGLMLGLLYLGALARTASKNFGYYPVLVFALAGPMAIDVFLYASYKSLDFGLLLMVAASLGFSGERRDAEIASV